MVGAIYDLASLMMLYMAGNDATQDNLYTIYTKVTLECCTKVQCYSSDMMVKLFTRNDYENT